MGGGFRKRLIGYTAVPNPGAAERYLARQALAVHPTLRYRMGSL